MHTTGQIVFVNHDLKMFLRYVTANAKLSTSVVNTLRDCVPEYLHNRSHWFICHCIKRMRSAEDLIPEQAVRVTEDMFQVTMIHITLCGQD